MIRETLRAFFVPPISSDQPARGKAKLHWIVRLRWLALSAQLLAIVPALDDEILERSLLPAYLGVIALLASVNLLTWARLRWVEDVSDARIALQLGLDIGALSCLLALTGGAWNPLVPILFVHTGLGALLLEGHLSLLFFALLAGCLGLIQAYSHIPPGLRDTLLPREILFPAQFVVALAFWVLTSWLSSTLTGLQRHFARMGERKTRIDRLRAVGALAAGLSHEFATPLNTAQLKLDRLARTRGLAADPDLQTASEALERCGDVLRQMAGSQLRPEGLDLQSVDVAAIVRQVAESAAQDRPEAGIHFDRDIRAARYALLPGVAFSHAILNLIDNALESGGDEVAIQVRSRPGQIDVAVADNGNGWPDVVRRHLGEPFVTTKPDGVGLGLYYVYTLAETVGAKLYLEDREAGGAIARVAIPELAAAERSP